MFVIVCHRGLVAFVPIAALLSNVFWCNIAHADDSPEQNVLASVAQIEHDLKERARLLFEVQGVIARSTPGSLSTVPNSANQFKSSSEKLLQSVFLDSPPQRTTSRSCAKDLDWRRA